MPINRQVTYNLAFTADTSKARQQMQDLQRQLDELMKVAASSTTPMGITSELQEASQAAAMLKAQIESAMNPKTGTLDLGLLNQSFQQAGVKLSDYQGKLAALGPAGTKAFAQVAQGILSAEVPLRQSTGLLSEFAVTLKNAARWQLSSTILHGFVGSIQSAYGYAKDLNESLNNIRIVTGQSTEQMAQFATQANRAAKELSSTTTEYTNAALIYYQQGLSDQEVQERTDVTIKMANVARESAETVSDQMTAIWNNFYDGSESLEYYADAMTALGAATATSTDEIAEGISKFAGVADTIGLSYEYAAASLATITATTRQSADTVGNALKTLFSRLEGLNLGETLDDGTTLNKYSAALATVGVQIKEADGELRSMDEILYDLGERWDTLAKDQQVALAQTVAGVRQYNQLITLMDNWDFFQENLETIEQSEGTLAKQQEIYSQGWEAARDRVTAALEDIYNKLVDSNFFIGLSNAATGFLGIVSSVIEGLGGVKGVLSGLGVLVTQIFGDSMAQSIDQFFYNLQDKTQVANQMRQEALQAFQQMGQSEMGEAYASLVGPQQALIRNAERLTETEKTIAQNLIEQQKYRIQNVQKAEEEKRVAEQTLQEVVNQARILARNEGANASQRNAITEIVESAQQAVPEMEKAGQAVEEVFSLIDNAAAEKTRISIDDIKAKFKELGVEVEKLPAKIQELYAEITSDGSGQGSQAVGWLNKRVAQMQELLSGGVGGAFETGIHDALYDAGLEGEQLEQIVQSIIDKLNGTEQATRNFDNKLRDAKDSGEELEKVFDRLQGKTITVGQTITGFARTLSSYSMALRQVSGMFDVFSDDNISGGQKLISLFTTLGMVVPSVISGFNGLKTALEGVGVAAGSVTMAAGVLTAAIAAVGLGIMAYNKYWENVRQTHLDAAEASQETLKAIQDERTEVESLAQAYQDALKVYNDTGEERDSLIDAAFDVAEALGIENAALLVQEEDYDALTAAIKRATDAKRDSEILLSDRAQRAQEDVFEDVMRQGRGWKDLTGGYNTGILGTAKNEGFKAELQRQGYSTLSSDAYRSGELGFAVDTTETSDLIAVYEEVQDVIDRAYDYAESHNLKVSDLVDIDGLQSFISKSSDAYETLMQLREEGKGLQVDTALGNLVDSESISSLSDYDALLEKAQDTLLKLKDSDQNQLFDEAGALEAAKAWLKLNDATSEYANTRELLSEKAKELGINEKDFEDIYNSFSEEDREFLFKLAPDMFTSRELTKAGVDQLKAETAEEELKVKITTYQDAQDNWKEGMDVDDIQKFYETSNIDWGNAEEGIIEFSEFLGMTYQEQITYLKGLQEQAQSDMNQSSADALSATEKTAEEKSNRIHELLETIIPDLENALDDDSITGAMRSGLTQELANARREVIDLQQEWGDLSQKIANWDELSEQEKIEIILETQKAEEQAKALAATIKGYFDEARKIEIGGEMSDATFEGLSGLFAEQGLDLNNFVTTFEDGTHKVIGDAEEFNNVLTSVQVQPYLDAMQEVIDKQNLFASAGGHSAAEGLEGLNFQQASFREIENMSAEAYAEYSSIVQTYQDLTTFVEENSAVLQENANNAVLCATSMEQLDGIITSLMGLDIGDGAFDIDYLETYGQGLLNLALQYENCSTEIQTYNAALAARTENQNEATEAALAAAEADLAIGIRAGEDAAKYGLEADSIESLARSYQKLGESGDETYAALINNAELAADAATRYLRLNRGLESLQDSYDDVCDVLDDFTKGLGNEVRASDKASKSFKTLRSGLADMLDTTEDVIDAFGDDWLSDNADDIKKAINGDVEALHRLQEAAGQDIVFNLDDANLASGFDEFWNKFNALPDGYDLMMDADLINYIQSLVTAMQEAGMTQADIESKLSAMGIDVDLGPYEEALNEAVSMAAEAGAAASDAMASNMGTEVEMNSQTKTDSDTHNLVGNTITPNVIALNYRLPTYTANSEGGYDMGTPITGAGFVTGYSTSPQTVPATETKQTTATALKVKGATKSSGGKISSKNSGGGGGKGSGGGGGGGGGGGTAKPHTAAAVGKETKKPTRYQNVDQALTNSGRALDRLSKTSDRAFGTKKLESFDEQIKLLNDDVGNLDEKLKEIGDTDTGYLADDIKAVRDAFTDEDGNILMEIDVDEDGFLNNLEQLSNKAVDDYNAVVEKYNAWDQANEGVDENSETYKEQKEALDRELEVAENVYKKQTEALSQWQETWNLREDLEDQRLEDLRAIADARLEKITYKLDLVINVRDIKKQVRDFMIDIAESYGDVLTSTFDSSNRRGVLGLMGDNAQAEIEMLGHYTETYNGYMEEWAKYQAGDETINIEALASKMQDLTSETIASGEALLEWLDYWENLVPNAIDAARERFNYFLDGLEHQSTVLDTIKELYALQGVTYKTAAGFERIQKATEERMNASIAQARLNKDWNERVGTLLAEAEERLASAEEGTVIYDQAKAARDALLEEFNESQEAMLSSAQDAMEQAYEIYNTAIERAVYQFGQTLSNGMGLDGLSDKYDHYIDLEEQYFDKVNEAYHVASWYNKLQQDIDNTTSKLARDRLKSLQDEINARRESNTLNQYDLDILEAKYKVLQAQMELEDIQNNKTELRLVRDRQGNWNYQYTANADDIAAAEQAVLDAENEWYNLAKQQTKEVTSEIISNWSDCESAIQDIYSETSNFIYDEETGRRELTEEAQKKIADIREYYAEKNRILEQELQVAISDMNEAGAQGMIHLAASTHADIISDLTDGAKEAVATMKGAGQSSQEIMTSNLDEMVGSIKSFVSVSDLQFKTFSNNYANDLGAMVKNTTTFESTLSTLLGNCENAFTSLNTNINKVADESGTSVEGLGNKVETAAGQVQTFYDNGLKAVQTLGNQMTAAYDAAAAYDAFALSVENAVNRLKNLAIQEANAYRDMSGVDVGPDLEREDPDDWSAETARRVNAYLSGEGGEITEADWAWLASGRANKVATSDWKSKNIASTDTIMSVARAAYNGNETALELLNAPGWYDDDWEKNAKAKGFKTGGYTGSWGDEGKLAFLHEKELVLNAEDTENILSAVNVVRDIAPALFRTIGQMLDNSGITAMNMLNGLFAGAGSIAPATSETLEQNVHIEATFPNVTDSNEIEQALLNLTNDAAQYSRRRKS